MSHFLKICAASVLLAASSFAVQAAGAPRKPPPAATRKSPSAIRDRTTARASASGECRRCRRSKASLRGAAASAGPQTHVSGATGVHPDRRVHELLRRHQAAGRAPGRCCIEGSAGATRPPPTPPSPPSTRCPRSRPHARTSISPAPLRAGPRRRCQPGLSRSPAATPAPNGFNDPTPVAPVGGNPGTTLGEQRLNVYRYVAGIWEQNLQQPGHHLHRQRGLGSPDLHVHARRCWAAPRPEYLARRARSSVPGTWYPQAPRQQAGRREPVGRQLRRRRHQATATSTSRRQFQHEPGQHRLPGRQPLLPGAGRQDSRRPGELRRHRLLHETGPRPGLQRAECADLRGLRILADGSAYGDQPALPSIWKDFMYDSTVGKTWLNMTIRPAQGLGDQPVATWAGRAPRWPPPPRRRSARTPSSC